MEHFFPEILITYLACFRQGFYQTGYGYFCGFLIAQLLCGGRKTMTQIARTCFFVDKSLSSWERFISESQWSMPLLIKNLVGLTKKELKDHLLYAGYYLFAADTTYVMKTATRMVGVQRWSEKQNGTKQTVFGHHWGIGGLLGRFGLQWRCFPILTKLLSGQNHPFEFVVNSKAQAHPISMTESVLAMVRQVTETLCPKQLIVVVDAYFSKAPFLNPLMALGVSVVSRLRRDAVGFDDPVYSGRGRPPVRGQKWKLATLSQHFATQRVAVTLYGRFKTLRCVTRCLWLREVQRQVKVVVILTQSHPILLLSTNRSLTAEQIIEIYAGRFSLELAIRDLKQQMGFCQYQMTTTMGFTRFAQLCCCALTIGRLILAKSEQISWMNLEPEETQPFAAFSLTRLRRSLRRFVIKRLLFSNSASGADLEKSGNELESILRLAA